MHFMGREYGCANRLMSNHLNLKPIKSVVLYLGCWHPQGVRDSALGVRGEGPEEIFRFTPHHSVFHSFPFVSTFQP